jgi:hypothetical protein
MSFSAEMKDFIGAYSAGQKINASRTDQDYKEVLTDAQKQKTVRDNDPETLELASKQARAELAKTTDSMATAASNRAHLAATTGYTNALAKRIAAAGDPQAIPGSGLFPQGAVPLGPTPSGAPVAPGALPIGPSTLNTEAYADGGLVPDDEATEAVPDNEVSEAVPVNAPTDVSARGRTPGAAPAGLEGVISPALVHDATKAGYTWGANAYGLTGTGAIKSPSAAAKAKLFAQGHGGLTDEEMNAAKKAVDPEGKLTDSQRNMAALGTVYQFWANKGEGEKASKVAFQMLQHYRNATQRYAAIAAHAAESGDMDLATKAALKAYANVPDGRDIHIEASPDNPKQLIYYYTDEKGNEIAKGIATPQQLAASAMGLASGGFDKAILSAAGAREEASGPKGAVGKPQSATDRLAESKLPDDAIAKMQEQWQAKAENKDKPLDEGYWGDLKDAATHILQQNPKTTPREAAAAALQLVTPGKADPEKSDFKLIPGEEGQPHTVKFKNGLAIKLDDGQLETVMNARAARVKAATDKINADMEAGDKPSKVDQAVEGVKQVASGVAGAVGQDVEKFKKQAAGAIPEELMIRGKSAIDAAARAGVDVKDYLAKLLEKGSGIGEIGPAIQRAPLPSLPDTGGRGAIPVDDMGRPL